MEAALFTKLKAGVALVSDRIYGVHAPQKVVTPYIVYHQISPGREYTHGGFADLIHPRFQFSCFADTYESAKAVADQVISTLESWPGSGVQAAFIDGEFDDYENDTELYHVAVDAIIWK